MKSDMSKPMQRGRELPEQVKPQKSATNLLGQFGAVFRRSGGTCKRQPAGHDSQQDERVKKRRRFLMKCNT